MEPLLVLTEEQLSDDVISGKAYSPLYQLVTRKGLVIPRTCRFLSAAPGCMLCVAQVDSRAMAISRSLLRVRSATHLS